MINIRLSGSSTSGRLWIQLRNYSADLFLAESIVYGQYFTGQITTFLEIAANTMLGVQTREQLSINNGGLRSAIEIIRIK